MFKSEIGWDLWKRWFSQSLRLWYLYKSIWDVLILLWSCAKFVVWDPFTWKGAALAILDWWYTSTMVRDPNGDPVSLQPVNVEILLPEILEENGDGETRIVKSCCKLLSIWKTTCYRPLAVAFINARSALDHLFWLLGTQRIEAHFVRPILWHGAISSCLKLFVNGGRVSPSLNHQSHFFATQATCLSRI